MGHLLIAGVDEAGRGPLAGPVVAAAVILPPQCRIEGLTDSKRVTAKRREILAEIIKERALTWAVARAEVEEIDRINILQATFLAMQRAVASLKPSPHRALVDGNHVPVFACPAEAIVGGDGKVAAISAASILAKVTRDKEMELLDSRYPGYGLAKHKGYPTRDHLRAIEALGVTAIHRRSFKPIRELMEK